MSRVLAERAALIAADVAAEIDQLRALVRSAELEELDMALERAYEIAVKGKEQDGV